MSIQALIVDDEPLARTGVHQLLDSVEDVAVVGEAADGPERPPVASGAISV